MAALWGRFAREAAVAAVEGAVAAHFRGAPSVAPAASCPAVAVVEKVATRVRASSMGPSTVAVAGLGMAAGAMGLAAAASAVTMRPRSGELIAPPRPSELLAAVQCLAADLRVEREERFEMQEERKRVAASCARQVAGLESTVAGQFNHLCAMAVEAAERSECTLAGVEQRLEEAVEQLQGVAAKVRRLCPSEGSAEQRNGSWTEFRLSMEAEMQKKSQQVALLDGRLKVELSRYEVVEDARAPLAGWRLETVLSRRAKESMRHAREKELFDARAAAAGERQCGGLPQQHYAEEKPAAPSRGCSAALAAPPPSLASVSLRQTGSIETTHCARTTELEAAFEQQRSGVAPPRDLPRSSDEMHAAAVEREPADENFQCDICYTAVRGPADAFHCACGARTHKSDQYCSIDCNLCDKHHCRRCAAEHRCGATQLQEQRAWTAGKAAHRSGAAEVEPVAENFRCEVCQIGVPSPEGAFHCGCGAKTHYNGGYCSRTCHLCDKRHCRPCADAHRCGAAEVGPVAENFQCDVCSVGVHSPDDAFHCGCGARTHRSGQHCSLVCPLCDKRYCRPCAAEHRCGTAEVRAAAAARGWYNLSKTTEEEQPPPPAGRGAHMALPPWAPELQHGHPAVEPGQRQARGLQESDCPEETPLDDSWRSSDAGDMRFHHIELEVSARGNEPARAPWPLGAASSAPEMRTTDRKDERFECGGGKKTKSLAGLPTRTGGSVQEMPLRCGRTDLASEGTATQLSAAERREELRTWWSTQLSRGSVWGRAGSCARELNEFMDAQPSIGASADDHDSNHLCHVCGRRGADQACPECQRMTHWTGGTCTDACDGAGRCGRTMCIPCHVEHDHDGCAAWPPTVLGARNGARPPPPASHHPRPQHVRRFEAETSTFSALNIEGVRDARPRLCTSEPMDLRPQMSQGERPVLCTREPQVPSPPKGPRPPEPQMSKVPTLPLPAESAQELARHQERQAAVKADADRWAAALTASAVGPPPPPPGLQPDAEVKLEVKLEPAEEAVPSRSSTAELQRQAGVSVDVFQRPVTLGEGGTEDPPAATEGGVAGRLLSMLEREQESRMQHGSGGSRHQHVRVEAKVAFPVGGDRELAELDSFFAEFERVARLTAGGQEIPPQQKCVFLLECKQTARQKDAHYAAQCGVSRSGGAPGFRVVLEGPRVGP